MKPNIAIRLALGLIATAALLSGCVGLPQGIEPVRGFELERYLGKWYEIARLDHSFERGLEQVTAEYSLRDDGGVRVVNRGFDTGKGAWDEAVGKAYFVETEDLGYLKVSFFGPFYGAYVVFGLDDENYRYSDWSHSLDSAAVQDGKKWWIYVYLSPPADLEID